MTFFRMGRRNLLVFSGAFHAPLLGQEVFRTMSLLVSPSSSDQLKTHDLFPHGQAESARFFGRISCAPTRSENFP